MNIQEKIKQTKENGIQVTVPLIGTGTDDDPYRPDMSNIPAGCYPHIDVMTPEGKSDVDHTNKRVKVWLCKIKSEPGAIGELRKNIADTNKDIHKEKETP